MLCKVDAQRAAGQLASVKVAHSALRSGHVCKLDKAVALGLAAVFAVHQTNRDHGANLRENVAHHLLSRVEGDVAHEYGDHAGAAHPLQSALRTRSKC